MTTAMMAMVHALEADAKKVARDLGDAAVMRGPQAAGVWCALKEAVGRLFDFPAWYGRGGVSPSVIWWARLSWEIICTEVATQDAVPEDVDRLIVHVLYLHATASFAMKVASMTRRRGLRLRIFRASSSMEKKDRREISLRDIEVQTAVRLMLCQSVMSGDQEVAVALVKVLWRLLEAPSGVSLRLDEGRTWLSTSLRIVRSFEGSATEDGLPELLQLLHVLSSWCSSSEVVETFVPFMCSVLVDDDMEWCRQNPVVWPALCRVVDTSVGEPKAATHAVADMLWRGRGGAVDGMVCRGGSGSSALFWRMPRFWAVLKSKGFLRNIGSDFVVSAAPVPLCEMLCTVFVSAFQQEVVARCCDPPWWLIDSMVPVVRTVSRCVCAGPRAVLHSVCDTPFLETVVRVMVAMGSTVHPFNADWARCVFHLGEVVVAVDAACMLHDQLGPELAYDMTKFAMWTEEKRGHLPAAVPRAAAQALVPLWCHWGTSPRILCPFLTETFVQCKRWSLFRQQWCAAVARAQGARNRRWK